MKTIIRKATPSDAKKIAEVLAYTWQTTYKGLLSDFILEEKINGINEKANQIAAKIPIKNNYYVAEVANNVVGVLIYGKSRNSSYPNYGEINAIYVLKEYQGNKIGKKLFLTGINELINIGYNEMILNVLKGNPTIKFYEHFGGQKVATKHDQFGTDTIEEHVMLFKNLKEIINKF